MHSIFLMFLEFFSISNLSMKFMGFSYYFCNIYFNFYDCFIRELFMYFLLGINFEKDKLFLWSLLCHVFKFKFLYGFIFNSIYIFKGDPFHYSLMMKKIKYIFSPWFYCYLKQWYKYLPFMLISLSLFIITKMFCLTLFSSKFF